MNNERPRLLLIDGHSMAFRAFYALPDSMTTSTGQPVNAVYGFISMLVRLLETEHPTHLAVAFDVGSHTFRTDRFPSYKGTRSETPEAFKGQIPLIKEVLGALNIPALEKPEFEADDILATLAARGAEQDMEVLICSGDRDTLQLVNDKVTVLFPVKGVTELRRMDPDAVFEKYSVTPAQYPDLAALVGETSDNIPGVPGVGPKTAAKWLGQYSNLVTLLDNASAISGKVGEALRSHLEQVRLNREINTLLPDLDLPLDVTDTGLRGFNREALHEIADVLQWGGLRERLLKQDPAKDNPVILREVAESSQLLSSGANTAPGFCDPAGGPQNDSGLVAPSVAWVVGSVPPSRVPVETVSKPRGVQNLPLEILELGEGELSAWLASQAGPVAVAATGSGRSPIASDVWMLALTPAAPENDQRPVVVLDLTTLAAADDEALLNWLLSADKKKIFHGAKGTSHGLLSRGYPLDGVIFDTELAAYLSFPDARNYELEELALRLLNREIAQDDGQGELDFDDQSKSSNNVIANRAAAIADLAAQLQERLYNEQSTELIEELELPLAGVLTEMERTGIAVDVPYLEQLHSEFNAEVERAAAEAAAAIGKEINIGSPKQLQAVLFDQLHLPKTKKTKTGYTTDAAALTHLYAQTQHPFLAAVLRHRDQIKLRQIVEGLLKAVGPDGRIHSVFQQSVAATGRLSSSEPNLQNIPIRTEDGRQIRKAFIAGEGYETLVTADYSQIEMRIMAHLSGDPDLIEAFNSGEDLHRYVGSRVFGVEPSEVTPEMRAKVKAMSYGLAYGLSAFGLSGQLDITPTEAQKLMDDYFRRFGGVRDYLGSVVEVARKSGYTETLLGRRRYLPDLNSDIRQRRAMAERMALNAPIQGSAADIIKLAMLGVRRALKEAGLKSREVLQVHDELVIEAAPGEVEQCEEILRTEMAAAINLTVPLEVSVGVGKNWLEAGH